MKTLSGFIWGVVIVAVVLFTWIGGWRLVPKTLEWHRIVKRANWSNLASDSCELIRRCPPEGTNYHDSTLTNTPKSIQALDPISVYVKPDQLTVIFERGPEGWGLGAIEEENEWIIRSWPYHDTDKFRVNLTFKKDSNSGKPAGEPLGIKPAPM